MSVKQIRDTLTSLGSDDLSAQSYVFISNVMLELGIKNILLPADIEILFHYKQQRFAIRTNAQNSAPTADEESLLRSIDRVVDIFEPLKLNANDVLDVDDESLLRMELISGKLRSLRDSEKFEGIPLEEMAFCLEVFVLVFKKKEDFGVFRFILNRVNVTKFLRAVVSALEDFKRGKSETKTNRKVFRKISKIYREVYKLYILRNVQEDLSALVGQKISENGRLAALQQILETIKQNAKYFQIPVNLYNLLKAFFENLATFSKQLIVFEKIFKITLFFQLNKVFKHFLNTTRSCRTSIELKSLFQYVENLSSIQQEMEKLRLEVTNFYCYMEVILRMRSSINDFNGNISMNSEKLNDFIENISMKLEKIQSLKRITAVKLPFFHQLIYDEHFELNISLFVKIIDSILIELEVIEDRKIAGNLWESIDAETSIDPSQTKYADLNTFQSSSLDKHFDSICGQKKRYEFIIQNIRLLLSQSNLLTIDSIVQNYSKIPRELGVALKYWLRLYFNTLENLGMHSVKRKLLCDDVINHDLNLQIRSAITALVATETLFEDIGINNENLDGLKDLRTDGLKLIKTREKLLKIVSNLDIPKIKTFEKEVFLEKYLLSLERSKGPNYYTLDIILGFKLAQHASKIDYFNEFSLKINSNDFKLNVSLGLFNFSEALTLSPQNITLYDERMFAWSDLIDSLVRSGLDLTLWSSETVTFVTEKLVKFENIHSLISLSKFHDIADRLTKVIFLAGDDLFETNVFKEIVQDIEDSLLTEAIRFGLFKILGLIF